MEFAISANFRQSRSKLTPITPTVQVTARLPSNTHRSKKRFKSVTDSDLNDSSDQSFGSPAFALHQSIFEGRFKQINYFLKLGLSANSKDKYGRTSMMIACLCDFEEYGIQVTRLLMKYGADINIKDSLGQTVCYLAVSERRDQFFDFLADNYSVSIDFKQKDNEGNCLLNHVAQRGTSRMLRKIIDCMQDRKIELDIRNNHGYSALLLAIQADKYLNAYILMSKGNCSPSIQDNKRYFNALEWLLDRIRINKNVILNTRFRAKRRGLSSNQSMSYSACQRRESPDLMFVSKQRKVNPIKLRHISNCNQYYKSEGGCDHITSPNYSVEHHKSRYVPAVLQSQYTQYLQSAALEERERRKEPATSRVITAKSHISEKTKSDEEEAEEIIDEETSLKVLIQKLYEIIYIKMSESYRTKQFYNSGDYKPQSPTIDENEKSAKENKGTVKSRATSRALSQNKKLVNQASVTSQVKVDDANPKPEVEVISSVSTKSIIENPMESNIFNTEKNRKTPKLRAMQSAYEDERNTKEAVHSMLSLYVSNQGFGLNGTNSSFAHDHGWGHVTPIGHEKSDGMKSKANSMYKEKSGLSEKSRKRSMVSANSHVHFN